MIDLNSASTVGGRINWFIDQAIEAERDAEPEREYLGASILGDVCERAVQYRAMKTPPDPCKGFDARILRIFSRGHWGEGMAIKWLKAAGFLLLENDPDTGGQFAFSILGGRVRGHADGVLALWRGEGGSPVPLPCLWECKTLGAKGWKKSQKDKIRVAHPKYYGQMQLYMGELGLERGLFTAINADTMELHHEPVDYDAGEHAALVARAERILLAMDHGEIVPRGFADSTRWECRYCDYAGRCWNA